MNVRGGAIRFVHRPNANEMDGAAGTRVVTPHGDFADLTAVDLLPFSACGQSVDHLYSTAEQLHLIGFNEGVENKR